MKKTLLGILLLIIILVLTILIYRVLSYQKLDDVDKEAISIVHNLGWTIVGKIDEHTVVFPRNEENPGMQKIREIWGEFGSDFDQFRGHTLVVKTFRLKEKWRNHEELHAVVYTYEGKVLAGYKQIVGWVPGRDSLFTKD